VLSRPRVSVSFPFYVLCVLPPLLYKYMKYITTSIIQTLLVPLSLKTRGSCKISITAVGQPMIYNVAKQRAVADAGTRVDYL